MFELATNFFFFVKWEDLYRHLTKENNQYLKIFEEFFNIVITTVTQMKTTMKLPRKI